MKKIILAALCLAALGLSSCQEKIEPDTNPMSLNNYKEAMALADYVVKFSTFDEAKAYLTKKGYSNKGAQWFKSTEAANMKTYASSSQADFDARGWFLDVSFNDGEMVAIASNGAYDIENAFSSMISEISYHSTVWRIGCQLLSDGIPAKSISELMKKIDTANSLRYEVFSNINKFSAYVFPSLHSISYCAKRKVNLPVYFVGPHKKVAWAGNSMDRWDWGNVSSDGYRLLTKDEWDYLFNGRDDADCYWARGRIDNEDGTYTNAVLLLPDFSGDGFYHHSNNSRWEDNTYKESELPTGTIVLPCKGYYASDGGDSISKDGYFWTGSRNDYGTPYYLYFDKDLAPTALTNGVMFPGTTLMSLCYFVDVE